MPDRPLTPSHLKKSLEALVTGERRNQIYYLLASVAGLGVGCGLIWWSSITHALPESANSTKTLVSGAIPFFASALSVTRIAACEAKIAQYRAAGALKGSALVITVQLLEKAILSRGVGHHARDEK